MFFEKPAPGAGTNVVTGWVTVPIAEVLRRLAERRAVGGEAVGDVGAARGTCALGKVTFTLMSQFWFGWSGSVQGLVQVTVAGVVPTQPGWQSAAGVAPLNTVPGGSVSVTGPIAVRLSAPGLLGTEIRRR